MAERLPIPIVALRSEDIRKNDGRGGIKSFGECTSELRKNLANKFDGLLHHYEDKFTRYPDVPCVAKVLLKDEAIAKSHKPLRLLKKENCPVIGAGRLDEVYIKVTRPRIENTINDILHSTADKLQTNLTTIQEIKPYAITDIVQADLQEDLENNLHEEITIPVKIKLFDFMNEKENNANTEYFHTLLIKLDLATKVKKLHYSGGLNIIKLECPDKEKLKEIIQFNGVKSISYFPQFTSLQQQSFELGFQLHDLPFPEEGKEYPIIGLIDTGITPCHKFLEPWVYKRVSYVPTIYQNNRHGTFVAGVLLHGHFLNAFGTRETMFKILDVVALPNSDPEYGRVDHITEDDFIMLLHDVISTHCREVKIWNISMGTGKICDQHQISDFAMALDSIQDEYGVDIFLSVGNYSKLPPRGWPIGESDEHDDRLTIPAESVRSITVGSIAHKKGYVNSNQPSPFSRKGPGPNYIIKPELVGYGGNVGSTGDFTGCGIISFDEDGKLIENIGTSFSTPFVTGIYANICNNLTPDYSPDLAKALLIHSGKNPLGKKVIHRDHVKYLGFGQPTLNIDELLNCSKSSVTLLFQAEIEQGTHIEMFNFPYPGSLNQNGKWMGEIKMTLFYRPPLNPHYGQEYCRTNIDVSLGTYFFENSNGVAVAVFKGRVPSELKWEEKYERMMVEHGFKWSPIKSYWKSIKKGIKGEGWKLRIDCVGRAGDSFGRQPFALVVTIKDPTGQADIYSDIVQNLRDRGFNYNSLQVRERVGNKPY